MLRLPKKAKIFSLFIIIIGFITYFSGINLIIVSKSIYSVIFFIFLAIIAESLAIPIGNSLYLSVTFAVGLCAILVFHPLIASVIVSMGFLFFIEYKEGKFYHIFNTSVYKRIFNASVNCISAMLSGYVYEFGYKVAPNIKLSYFNILGIIFSIFCYIIINYLVFMTLFSLIEKKSFKKQIFENTWIVKNFLSIAPLGILMAVAYINYGWFSILLFFGPLLLARYSFKLYIDMRKIYFETIKALSNAIDAKDRYTNGHSHRVAHYSEQLARKMGLSNKQIDTIKTAAILHDIGKIGIEDYILKKPSNLTENEFNLIKQHPIIGANILKDVDFLDNVIKIIKHHHERYDGKGYPDGLKEAEIPIEAAILAVADSFDAMTSNRPYRMAMSFNTALNIILNESGKQFNPIVVKAFKDLMEEDRELLLNVS